MFNLDLPTQRHAGLFASWSLFDESTSWQTYTSYLLWNSASVCGPAWSAFGRRFCLRCVVVFPWDSRSFPLPIFISILSSSFSLRLPLAASRQLSRSLLNSRGLGCSLFLLAEEVLVCIAGCWDGGEALWGWVEFCFFFVLLVFFQSGEFYDRLHGVQTVCCGFRLRPEAVCSMVRFSGGCNSFLTEQLFVPLKRESIKVKQTSGHTLYPCFEQMKNVKGWKQKMWTTLSFSKCFSDLQCACRAEDSKW